MSVGVSKRLSRLFRPSSGRTLIVPIDDSLIAGPLDGLSDLSSCVRDIVSARPEGVLAFTGQLERHCIALRNTATICNVTGSTSIGMHTKKELVTRVASAVRVGADVVAVHINFTSHFENEMLGLLGATIDEATTLGIPVLAIAYPRREGEAAGSDDNYDVMRSEDPDAYTRLVAHAVRASVDLGASIVKTQYTGGAKSFSRVIQAADGVPTVIAGGRLKSPIDALSVAAEAIAAGASGVSFGRNAFNARDRVGMIRALAAVVHEDSSPEAAAASVKKTSG